VIISKNQSKSKKTTKPFFIVGLGASAGGLEAVSELLKTLPTNTGMAFVYLQHLDPKGKSALSEILSRQTSISVRKITHNLHVKPNHIYVIPPNHHLLIKNGVLKLKKYSRQKIHFLDSFFESLAQDQGNSSIGVILSGSGIDGTRGLESIKAEGGITFAQKTAIFDSMPHNAIEAGCVDFVLSPTQIAKELANIAKVSFSENGKAKTYHEPFNVSKDELEKILTLLHNHNGVDFSLYKPSTIERRISRRMMLNKKAKINDYVAFLQSNVKELEALYTDILINVTTFFRNNEAFEALKKEIVPQLLDSQGNDPIRIWIAGCSSGQEAYSIGMIFLETMEKRGKSRSLQIFATDLNETLLNKARSGFYPQAAIEDVSPDRLKRFFVIEEGGYRINKKLRDMCVFAKQNFTDDPPFSHLDLIACRNVLIYLDSSLQKKVMPIFHYALKPRGFLFLGASESVSTFTGLFDCLDKKHKLFIKKLVPSPVFQMRFMSKPSGKKQTIVPNLSPELNAQREADRIAISRYAPPAVLIDEHFQILQFRGDTSAYLQPPIGTANLNLLKMARENLIQPLRVLINKVQKEKKTVRKEDIHWKSNGRPHRLNIEAVPLKHLKEPAYLIIFEESLGLREVKTPIMEVSGSKGGQKRIDELEQELNEARDFAQVQQEEHEAVQEELKASNEEIQSTNEELQSINEELETSKEELESTNEELTTVNEELANRNTELNRLNSDLVNLQNNMVAGVLLLGKDLTIRNFSPIVEKIFNLLPADIGRPLGRFRHTLNYPNLEQLITEVIDTASVREREVQDKDGHWYFLRISPYTTIDNRMDGAVIMLVDIDNHKRNEQTIKELEAIRESDKRFRSMADQAPVLIWMSDTSKACTWFNKSWLDFVGRPLEKEIGNRWVENIHQEDLQRCLKTYVASFDTRQPFKIEFRLRRYDDQYRWVINNGVPMYEGEEFIGYIGTCTDITERIEVEQYRVRLSSIVESSDDAIISKDLNGIITSWNKAAQRIFGYEAEEVLGKSIMILIPNNRQNEEPEIQDRIRRGEYVDHYETIRQTKDGRLINISLTVSPIKDSKGTIIGASKIARDVTDKTRSDVALIENEARLRKLAQELVNSNRELEQFAYIASHDLKEPLHVVSSFTHLLEKKLDSKLDSGEKEYINFIKQGIHQAQLLIKDLLEYSRMGQERSMAPLNLNTVLVDVLGNLKVIIHTSNAMVNYEPLPNVTANYLAMFQLFQNLISNAIKYKSDKIPEITISCKQEKDNYLFCIKDNGIGIDLQYKTKIFEMFQRLHSKSEYSGTGIGLAICKRVVENHGGRIWVDSKPGDGSSFYFTIPNDSLNPPKS
jgi:two-component system CheB/CheR fusion protein